MEHKEQADGLSDIKRWEQADGLPILKHQARG